MKRTKNELAIKEIVRIYFVALEQIRKEKFSSGEEDCYSPFVKYYQDVEKANSCLILNDVSEFRITVTVDGMEQKTLAAPASIDYNTNNGSAVPEAVIPDFDSVVVVGPASVVESLTADDIHLVADLSKIKEGDTGFITVPVACENNDSYWIYGEYTANAQEISYNKVLVNAIINQRWRSTQAVEGGSFENC